MVTSIRMRLDLAEFDRDIRSAQDKIQELSRYGSELSKRKVSSPEELSAKRYEKKEVTKSISLERKFADEMVRSRKTIAEADDEVFGEKALSKLSKFRQGFESTFGPSIISKMFTKLGMGGAGGGFSGVASLGAAGIGGAMAGGVLTAAMIRGAMGVSTFAGQSGLRLRARGLGVSPDEFQNVGLGLGYGPSASLEQASALAMAGGNISPSLLEKAQGFGRTYGMDPSELGGILGVVRRGGATGTEQERRFSAILSDAIASKLEDSRLGEFLATTASSVESLQERGGVIDSSKFALALAATMTSSGIFSDPTRAAKYIGSMDATIRSGAGFQTGFYRQAFGKLMPGSGPLAQYLQMTGSGLFKTDMSQYEGVLRPDEMSYYKSRQAGLGFGATTKEISSRFNQLTAGKSFETQELIARQLTNLPGMEGLALFRRLETGQISSEDFLKAVKDASISSEEKLAGIRFSTEGTFEQLKALNESQLVTSGGVLLEALLPISSALLGLERGLMKSPGLRILGKILGFSGKNSGSDILGDTGETLGYWAGGGGAEQSLSAYMKSFGSGGYSSKGLKEGMGEFSKVPASITIVGSIEKLIKALNNVSEKVEKNIEKTKENEAKNNRALTPLELGALPGF